MQVLLDWLSPNNFEHTKFHTWVLLFYYGVISTLRQALIWTVPPCRYVHFASCFPIVIYNVFMHNKALWSNSNALFLIICNVYTKRKNTGSWNSGPEKAMSELPILHNSNWAEILRRIILENIKNTRANK